ncbi:MAG TPA: hypothetical protein VEQ60_02300, partial [Longimicrobium sp.]|nr:hypothetical protein [Longimicrobium sp.]
VQPPRYVPVSVEADVFAVSLDRVAAVEQEVHHALREFLHPLRGGPRGAGGDFGRPVAVSDLFVVLEGIGGVDHVENLRLHFTGRASGERVQVGRDELIAWAEPQIRMRFV